METVAAAAYRTRECRRYRSWLAANRIVCVHCHERRATTPDHQAPLSDANRRGVPWAGTLLPSCWPCSVAQGASLGGKLRSRGTATTKVAPLRTSRAW
jgi:hypothetical protein